MQFVCNDGRRNRYGDLVLVVAIGSKEVLVVMLRGIELQRGWEWLHFMYSNRRKLSWQKQQQEPKSALITYGTK